MPKYRAHFVATLPASAWLDFEAADVDAAQEYAEAHAEKASWDGADYNRPQGADIEVFEIEEQP